MRSFLALTDIPGKITKGKIYQEKDINKGWMPPQKKDGLLPIIDDNNLASWYESEYFIDINKSRLETIEKIIEQSD